MRGLTGAARPRESHLPQACFLVERLTRKSGRGLPHSKTLARGLGTLVCPPGFDCAQLFALARTRPPTTATPRRLAKMQTKFRVWTFCRLTSSAPDLALGRNQLGWAKHRRLRLRLRLRDLEKGEMRTARPHVQFRACRYRRSCGILVSTFRRNPARRSVAR
jgi:hypothetical protein